jgi:glycosyltransferase involved in cell wall biosynthesis
MWKACRLNSGVILIELNIPRPRPRTFILADQVGPYHNSRYNELSKNEPITICETNRFSATYSWGLADNRNYNSITLFDRGTPGFKKNVVTIKRTLMVLFKEKPEVIFAPGYSATNSLAAFFYGLLTGVRVVLMSATGELDFKRSRIVELYKKLILQGYSGFFVGGSRQRAYLKKLGAAPNLIVDKHNVVDNDHFKVAERRYHAARERVYLCVSRLVEKKNLFYLINEFRKMLMTGSRSRLVIVGDGPQHSELKAHIEKHKLSASVTLVGFIGYNDLPEYYSNSSALILPSLSEQWGLVVNEAMASGLPVIVSEKCGCVVDLVSHGINGYVFDPQRTGALEKVLVAFDGLANDAVREMSRQSRLAISEWGLREFARAASFLIDQKAKISIPTRLFVIPLVLAALLRSLFVIRK